MEHSEYKNENEDYNGHLYRKAFEDKKMLELRVPRTPSDGFYPAIRGLLKNQLEVVRTLSITLYKLGLTTEQVGDIFNQFYGKHYSTSQVSSMFDDSRKEIKTWLKRDLFDNYLIIYVDATIYTNLTHSQGKQRGLLHNIWIRSPPRSDSGSIGCVKLSDRGEYSMGCYL